MTIEMTTPKKSTAIAEGTHLFFRNERIMIIASDLKDNVGYKAKFNLTKVKVAVIGFPTSKNPSKTLRLRNKWTRELTESGAVKVIFLPIEEEFTMDIFGGT